LIDPVAGTLLKGKAPTGVRCCRRRPKISNFTEPPRRTPSVFRDLTRDVDGRAGAVGRPVLVRPSWRKAEAVTAEMSIGRVDVAAGKAVLERQVRIPSRPAALR